MYLSKATNTTSVLVTFFVEKVGKSGKMC